MSAVPAGSGWPPQRMPSPLPLPAPGTINVVGGGCTCSIPEDGVFVHLTVENAVCPKVTGRRIQFALTPQQLVALRDQITDALADAGWAS